MDKLKIANCNFKQLLFWKDKKVTAAANVTWYDHYRTWSKRHALFNVMKTRESVQSLWSGPFCSQAHVILFGNQWMLGVVLWLGWWARLVWSASVWGIDLLHGWSLGFYFLKGGLVLGRWCWSLLVEGDVFNTGRVQELGAAIASVTGWGRYDGGGWASQGKGG